MPFPNTHPNEIANVAGFETTIENPDINYSEHDPNGTFEDKQDYAMHLYEDLDDLIRFLNGWTYRGQFHMIDGTIPPDNVRPIIEELRGVAEDIVNLEHDDIDEWIIRVSNILMDYEIEHARGLMQEENGPQEVFEQIPQEQLDQLWTEQNDINHQRLEAAIAAGTHDVPRGPFDSTKHTDSQGKETTWPASDITIEKKNFSSGKCGICFEAADIDGGWCMLQCPGGHVFHCSCFNGYAAQRGISHSTLTCPLCRTPVTMMSPLNVEQLKQLEELKEKETAFGKRKKFKKLIISDILYLKKLNKII